MNSLRPRQHRRLRVVAAAAVMVAVVLAVVDTTSALDWFRLLGYHPPSDVSQLAADDTMTPAALHLYYLNRPTIEDQKTFAKHCPAGSEKSIVLGCYHNNEQGIYLLSVSDPRLSGVEEVTAAHETLHAAYSRLSTADKKYVDGLLENYYQHGLTDQRIKATLKSYETSEPGQQLNEMHSIFGTEIKNLPAPLENYYKRYFTDRAKIAGYAAQYQSAFTSREAQVSKDDAQLKTWKQQIDIDESELAQQKSALNNAQTQLDADKTDSQIGAYNALVPDYNAKVDDFNDLLANIKNLIDQYNQLVSARNDIAGQETQLQNALSGESLPSAQH